MHAALAYYFANRDAIIQEIKDDNAFVDIMRARIGTGPLHQRAGDVDANDAIQLDELVDEAIARGARTPRCRRNSDD